MATEQQTHTDWRSQLRAGAHDRISDSEKVRRRAETRRVLAFRDGLPGIAPDTTETYIDEIGRERSRD